MNGNHWGACPKTKKCSFFLTKAKGNNHKRNNYARLCRRADPMKKGLDLLLVILDRIALFKG